MNIHVTLGDPCQWNTLLSHFAYRLQDLFGGLHSHTFHFFKQEFLTPFAL